MIGATDLTSDVVLGHGSWRARDSGRIAILLVSIPSFTTQFPVLIEPVVVEVSTLSLCIQTSVSHS